MSDPTDSERDTMHEFAVQISILVALWDIFSESHEGVIPEPCCPITHELFGQLKKLHMLAVRMKNEVETEDPVSDATHIASDWADA